MVDTHYRAFISYSHRDAHEAAALHRHLEHYAVPTKLVGRLTAEGSVPRRLTPIFRDREDLPTAGDLSATVQKALERTRFLIVLCSPAAAASEWVNKEIVRFKTLHGDVRILPVILDKETTRGVTALDALFPPALRFEMGADGALTQTPVEPLAADLRESADGPKRGFLKVVAGLIGVNLDDLTQRDSARRQNRFRNLALASVAATAAMAFMTTLAIRKGNEAAAMRAEAEGLVEFMLTDLRDKLEPVGRLDALDVVGDRALAYYGAQDESRLDAEALARRARALLLVGEIDFYRNEFDASKAAYAEAEDTTAELLRRAPDDAQRVFDHAQSVFYVGSVALELRDLEKAEAQLNEYMRLAERLVAIDPENPEWRMELASATNNLGALAYSKGRLEEAVPFIEQSVEAHRRLAIAAPQDQPLQAELAAALSWLAYLQIESDDFAGAVLSLREELNVYEANDGEDNFESVLSELTARRRLADALTMLGDTDEALEEALRGVRLGEALLARDAENDEWSRTASHAYRRAGIISDLIGDREGARRLARRALQLARQSTVQTEEITSHSVTRGDAIVLALQVFENDDDRRSIAAELREIFELAKTSDGVDDANFIARSALALARHETRQGRPAIASRYLEDGFAAIANGRSQDGEMDAEAHWLMAELKLLAGRTDEAAAHLAQAEKTGARHPRLAALRAKTAQQ